MALASGTLPKLHDSGSWYITRIQYHNLQLKTDPLLKVKVLLQQLLKLKLHLNCNLFLIISQLLFVYIPMNSLSIFGVTRILLKK